MRHLLHITPSFAPGGAQVRAVLLMNHFGERYRHTILSLDERLHASSRIASNVRADCIVVGKTSNPAAMMMRLSQELRRRKPDLVLTYNWGSIDGAAAASLSGFPVVHTEDGFGPEEAKTQKSRRVWTRRIVLRNAARVVAPSICLADIMRGIWHLPEGRIAYIPNGIDTSRFAPVPCRPDSGKELVIGTVGHLRREKNLGLLLRSVAALSRKMPVRLIIAGDGPERDALEREARELGIAGNVVFAGWQEDLPSTYSQFDIFALSSTTEQMPLSVLEAMASGLPVVSTHVGDVARMVAEVNRPAVVSPLDFESALKELAERPDWRARLGIANRARAVEAYSIERMFEDYDRLYTALSS